MNSKGLFLFLFKQKGSQHSLGEDYTAECERIKSANYPVPAPETLGCCCDNFNSAHFSPGQPIFQSAPPHFLLSCYFTLKIHSFLESCLLLTLGFEYSSTSEKHIQGVKRNRKRDSTPSWCVCCQSLKFPLPPGCVPSHVRRGWSGAASLLILHS